MFAQCRNDLFNFGVYYDSCVLHVRYDLATASVPDWVRMIASALPSTWATNAMAGLNQMGLPFSDVLMDIVMMLILGLFIRSLGYLLVCSEMANCVILAICLTAAQASALIFNRVYGLLEKAA